jgi:hypothetical protein
MINEKRCAEAKNYHAAAMERVKNTPAPEGQKYKPGQRVRIADNLRRSMSFFPRGRCGTVHHTYSHAYQTSDERSLSQYCIDIDGIGAVAWYDENQLTAVVNNER